MVNAVLLNLGCRDKRLLAIAYAGHRKARLPFSGTPPALGTHWRSSFNKDAQLLLFSAPVRTKASRYDLL